MEATAETNKRDCSLSAQMKMNILRYIVVCSFLAVVNYITNPSYWWFLWVVAGWGLDLSLNIISQYFIKQEEEKNETYYYNKYIGPDFQLQFGNSPHHHREGQQYPG